jgi:23S rRNA pseudouridine1911/1915/1917 synthase
LVPAALARAIPQPDLALAVLAGGSGWLAVDKPAGMPVHPLRDLETGTVLNALVARRPEVQGVGEAGLRSGVVHRLDVDTSGVLLMASEVAAWGRLRGAFREHRVQKLYRAIVWGELSTECHLELGLAVAQHRPARVRVVAESEKEDRRGVWRIEQHVRPLEVMRGATLVEVRPRTGFLHQIRATLAHLGHPVVGDAIYGGALEPSEEEPGAAEARRPIRQMLHAAEVALDDDIHAAAPDPPDFAELLDQIRQGTLGSRSRSSDSSR